MRIKNLLATFYVVFALAACKQNKHSTSPIYGHWILTDYMDSILNNKSIVKPSRKHLAWFAIMLKIENDSFHSYGLIYASKSKMQQDSNVLRHQMTLNEYDLTYDESKNLIYAKMKDSNGTDKNHYVFRRARKDEAKLFKPINSRHSFMHLSKRFRPIFIDNILVGKYRKIGDGPAEIIELFADGKVSGYRNYKTYSIDDYFGTYHPYTPEDGICFQDTSILRESDQPPSEEESIVYSWKFKKDTFILTKMATENYDTYFNTKEKLTYLKLE